MLVRIFISIYEHCKDTALSCVVAASMPIVILSVSACADNPEEALLGFSEGPNGSVVVVSEIMSSSFQGDSGDVYFSFISHEHVDDNMTSESDISTMIKHSIPLVHAESSDVQYEINWPRPNRVEIALWADNTSLYFYHNSIVTESDEENSHFKIMMVY